MKYIKITSPANVVLNAFYDDENEIHLKVLDYLLENYEVKPDISREDSICVTEILSEELLKSL